MTHQEEIDKYAGRFVTVVKRDYIGTRSLTGLLKRIDGKTAAVNGAQFKISELRRITPEYKEKL